MIYPPHSFPTFTARHSIVCSNMQSVRTPWYADTYPDMHVCAINRNNGRLTTPMKTHGCGYYNHLDRVAYYFELKRLDL